MPTAATHARRSAASPHDGLLNTDQLHFAADNPQLLHIGLNQLARVRMLPSTPDADPELDSETMQRWQAAEMAFLAAERHAVRSVARAVPRSPGPFVSWFESLKANGPGQGDALFPWLAESADLEQMRWFIQQEVAGEAGFEDLLALTQLRMPTCAKLEIARNYWDEMGRGAEPGMHGPMLAESARALGINPEPDQTLIWEALALGNMMLALAYNRQYAYHSVGALGVIELTSPTRVGHVAEGLRRLGVSKQGSMYFSLHASVDVRHSRDWNREVLYSLVAENSDLAIPIAEGALMRLNAGARCFARYRREFGLARSGQVLN